MKQTCKPGLSPRGHARRRELEDARDGRRPSALRGALWGTLMGLAGLGWAGLSGGGFAWAQPPPAKAKPATSGLSMTIRVVGLRNDKGDLAVALFDREQAFPQQERALRGKVTTIREGAATVVFSGLKPGSYAAAVLHDENRNHKMDFNWLGMPLEGYGFSRDASALFGPPSFEDAAVTISSSSRIWIKMRYFSL